MLKFRQWLNEQFLLKENNIQKEKDRWNSYGLNTQNQYQFDQLSYLAYSNKHKRDLLDSAARDMGMSGLLRRAFIGHPAAKNRTMHKVQMIYDKQRMGIEKDESHIEHSPIDHIVDRLADGDPAKDKKHLNHIVTWYHRRQFRAEDVGDEDSHREHPNWNTVHGTLKAFSDSKNKEHFPDIQNPQNQKQMLKGTSLKSYNHMSFPEFRTHVHKQLGLDKVNEGPFEHSDAKQVFEKEGTKINHIQSKQAAIHLNKCTGVKWCTGWEGPDNMYNHYAKDGKIYHIHTNDGSHYQVHLPSHQFMDKENSPVDPKDIAEKHPELRHFKPFHDYSSKDEQDYPFKTKEEKQQIAGEKLSALSNYIHQPGSTPQQQKVVNGNRMFIEKHGTDKQVDDMYDNINNPVHTVK
jgi:hypothetical protein